jgi:FkbM family methyltransferase
MVGNPRSPLVLAKNLMNSFEEYEARYQAKSKSQLAQDLWALWKTQEKRNGFFVEFGAADGIYTSNTYLLAKEYGWTGILAEPMMDWFPDLITNRPESGVVQAAIVHDSANFGDCSKITFRQALIPELSCVEGYQDGDHLAGARKAGIIYEVDAWKLPFLLKHFNAPRDIDYMSIDVEGMELDILRTFDFSKWNIRFLTIEHNWTSQREPIQRVMEKNGYSRSPYSRHWDDWYEKVNV